MTYKEAVEEFTTDILPTVRENYEQYGVIDVPARREAWNDWMDVLCKDGDVTEHQYNNWCLPDELE